MENIRCDFFAKKNNLYNSKKSSTFALDFEEESLFLHLFERYLYNP